MTKHLVLSMDEFEVLVTESNRMPEVLSINFVGETNDEKFRINDHIHKFPNIKKISFDYDKGFLSLAEDVFLWFFDEGCFVIIENIHGEGYFYLDQEELEESFSEFVKKYPFSFQKTDGYQKCKHLEWIDSLYVENFEELLNLPNLTYIHRLTVGNCSYDKAFNYSNQLVDNKNKYAEDLRKKLKTIHIDCLNILFMSGSISCLKFLKPEIKEIKIYSLVDNTDFNFEFINNYKVQPDVWIRWYNLVESFKMDNAFISDHDILNCQNHIKFKNKKRYNQFNIDFFAGSTRSLEGDIRHEEYSEVSLEFYPIIK